MLPESLVNLDINFSTQYNAFLPSLQWKAVVGSNNSGIVLGIQRETINKISGAFNPYGEKWTEPTNYGVGRAYLHRLSDGDIEEALSVLNAPGFVPDDEIYWTVYDYDDEDAGWTFKLGYQYALPRGFYVNAGLDITTNRTKDAVTVGYGYYDWFSGNYYNDSYFFEDKGWALGVRLWTGLGYALSLGKDKRYYLNAEATYTSLQLTSIIERSFVINAGFGFRIGSQPRTTIEGATESNTVKIQR